MKLTLILCISLVFSKKHTNPSYDIYNKKPIVITYVAEKAEATVTPFEKYEYRYDPKTRMYTYALPEHFANKKTTTSPIGTWHLDAGSE